MDMDRIKAQEFDWMYKNEPTFTANGNRFVGKVGRAPNGEDIRVQITIPEFYPVVKPDVVVLNAIRHPNINSDRSLDLQILDDWDLKYRLKDIISATRRLFIRSRAAIKVDQVAASPVMSRDSKLEDDIASLQIKISQVNKSINDLKLQKLQKSGFVSHGSNYMKITKLQDDLATSKALEDLLDLIEIKFEDADIDQTDFFRLYRKYIKEAYIMQRNLQMDKVKNKSDEKKSKQRPIAN